jgi:Right handed beta helix region
MSRSRLFFFLVFLSSSAFAQSADLGGYLRAVGTPFAERYVELVLEVVNHGPDGASSIVALWSLPFEPLPTSFDPRCTLNAADRVLRCEAASLGSGQSTEFRATKLMTGHGQGTFANITAATPDPNADNNDPFAFIHHIFPPAELRADIFFPRSFNPDRTLTIRYEIENQSETRAPLRVLIGIPRAIELVAVSGAQCSGPAPQLDCSLSLPAGTRVPVDVTVRFPEAAGLVETSLEIRWNGYDGEGISRQASTLYPRILTVTSTADSGPGSLRQTILDANLFCANRTRCRIRFAVDGPIRPLTPLPEFTAPLVSVEGPATLDGANLTEGNGLSFLRVEEWSVSKMVIGNFPENGVFAIPPQNGQAGFSLIDNYLGVDPTGTMAMPNNRGAMLYGGHGVLRGNVLSGNRRSGAFLWGMQTLGIEANRIGVAAFSDAPIGNGASGIFVGSVTQSFFTGVDFKDNVIANNGHFGIGLGTDVYAHVMANRIMNNVHGGIDIGLDGPTPGGPVPVPRIDRVVFDGQATVIEGMLPPHVPGSVQAFYSVSLYANSQLDPGGYAEGERYLGDAAADPSGYFRFVYAGDLRGLYVNGVTVQRNDFYREYFRVRTSEFGQAVAVTAP